MTSASVLLLLPSLLLAGGSLLRSVPGEWSRSALLAWSAVLLAHLAAQIAAPDLAWLRPLFLVPAFAALVLGATPGLVVAALALAALALSPSLPAPGWVPALAALAAALGAARAFW